MKEQTAVGDALTFVDQDTLRQQLAVQDTADVPAEAEADPALARQADDVVARIMEVDMSDVATQDATKSAVESMGLQLQKEAGRRSNMLKQPIGKLSRRAEDGGEVANALVDLKVRVEDLDPGKFDFEAGWFTRLLGRLPGVGTPLKRYFSRYEDASTVIDAIVRSLKDGQEQLKRDNITLQDDQKAMRALSLKLQKAIALGQLIDKKLQAKLEMEIPSDDPRYKFVQEELQFPLRQRIQDLQQQLLVSQQGFLTVEMIVRNNKELIRGVNRAVNVTVSALQVAVTLALALANQRIVLEKVQAVSATTNNLIAGTSARLKQQGAEIHKQASSTQLDMDVLKQSFADIEAALDDISHYRQEALPKMAATILEMDELAAKSEETIRGMEASNRARADFAIEILDE